MSKLGIAICTPMPMTPGPAGSRLEPITVEWHRARHHLAIPTNFSLIEVNIDGMEVGEARCRAVDIAMGHDPRPEFLFFLDYDVLPLYDAITKLVYRARCFPKHDIFSGVYCSKSSPPEPLIYTDTGLGPHWDWTVGDVIHEGIVGVHSGLTLIRLSLFDRMEYDTDNPLYKTREKTMHHDKQGLHSVGGTEDLYFCRRAIEEADAKILVDTSVLAGHINNKSGQIFGLPDDCPPVLRCPYMGSQEKRDEKQEGLRCLDIGAGENRRTWEGYKTFTLDIRPECKPDYQQDTRQINFPDDHWDMVASSHHLEHIGRWDQEKVWKEMFRILKPGGKTEHIVPNLEWAAQKLFDKQPDEHVFNVIYGAQEIHGYEREWNTHLFGFTPAIARELAEGSGLVDVEIRTFTDDENLGYNLVLTGRKPEENKPETDTTAAIAELQQSLDEREDDENDDLHDASS